GGIGPGVGVPPHAKPKSTRRRAKRCTRIVPPILRVRCKSSRGSFLATEHVMRSPFGLVLLTALGATACSTAMPEPPPLVPASSAAPPTFTWAPPAHMRFARTERRSVEMAIVGTDARSVDEEVLRWNVDAHRLNTTTIVDQELSHVTLRHNGRTL